MGSPVCLLWHINQNSQKKAGCWPLLQGASTKLLQCTGRMDTHRHGCKILHHKALLTLWETKVDFAYCCAGYFENWLQSNSKGNVLLCVFLNSKVYYGQEVTPHKQRSLKETNKIPLRALRTGTLGLAWQHWTL